MAATNWTIVRRNRLDNTMFINELGNKWTYKTALGIAKESTNNELFELVCVVETNKIMLKNDKKEEKKSDI
jgi:hypothetical protein